MNRKAAVAVYALVFALATGQFAAAQGPQPGQKAGDFFKNVQILKDIPANLMQPTMQFMEISLGVHCVYCHDQDNTKRELDVKPTKARAREMLRMVNTINETTFGGRQVVTCYTCHRGATKPVVVLPHGGGEEMPGGIANQARQRGERPIQGQAPTVDQVLDRHINGIGGAESLAKVTSITGKGTVTNYAHLDEVHQERPLPIVTPVDFVVKGDKSMLVQHNANGDAVQTYNAGSGWARAGNGNANDLRPDVLDVAKLQTAIYNPTMFKQIVTGMQVTGQDVIGNLETTVITGRMTTLPVVKLYFDRESGKLVSVYYQQPSGFCCHAFRMDVGDYTVQGGIQVPARITTVGVRDSFTVYRFDTLQANAAVDDARFAKPAGR
jgi:hypothetical protein